MASLYLGTGPLEQELVRLRGSRPGGAGRCLQTSRCAAPGAGGERPFLGPVAWPALALVAPILGRSGGRGGRGEAQPWPLTLLVSVPLAPHRVPAAPEAASGGGVLWCRLLSADGVCPGRGVPSSGCARSGAWPARGPFLTVSPGSAPCAVAGGLSGEHPGKVTPSEVSFRPQGVHPPGLPAGLQRWVPAPLPASVPPPRRAGWGRPTARAGLLLGLGLRAQLRTAQAERVV